MALNTARKGYTAPRTKHVGVKHTLSGKKKPETPVPGWETLVVPGPQPTGVKRPYDSGAPVSVPVDITASVEHAPKNSPARRIRRALARKNKE